MSAIREQIQLPPGHSFRLLHWRENLREVDLVLNPRESVRIEGEGTHWHYHPAIELTWFEAGSGTRFVGDRIQPFHAGDLVLLGGNLPHYWHLRGVSAGWSVQWCFPSTHAFWTFPEADALSGFFRSASRGIQFRGHTVNLLSSGLRELAGMTGLDRLGALLRLLARAAHTPAVDREFISANSFSLATESRHQTAMQAAIRFVLEHYRTPIRQRQLLSVTRMSKPTFSRQFKKHAGKTLNQLLQQVRLDAACCELLETDHAITDVALGNGFSQISAFNRMFRRANKCSPSEYRRRRASAGPGT